MQCQAITEHWIFYSEHAQCLLTLLDMLSLPQCITDTHLPSKLPVCLASSIRSWKVCNDGSNTNTPELKQSGQPMSGAADSSSRSNSSSTFCKTSVSASRKTHLAYWHSLQALIFEKVTPSSGRANRARCSASPESRSSMSMRSSHTLERRSLGEKNCGQISRGTSLCHF